MGHDRDRHEIDTAGLRRVGYREFKILLEASRFADPRCFHDFWKIVKRTAERLEVEARKSEAIDDPRIREVLFHDTGGNDLYNHSFILRKRTLFKGGSPVPGPELVLKFRNADLAAAAAVDMRPREGASPER